MSTSVQQQLEDIRYQYSLISVTPDRDTLGRLVKAAADSSGDDERLRLWWILYKAVRRGNTEVIRTILTNLPQSKRLPVLLMYSQTPLHTASLYGNTDSVRELLSPLTPGQQLRLINYKFRSQTAADMASERGHTEIVEILRNYTQRAEESVQNKNNGRDFTTKLKTDENKKLKKDLSQLSDKVHELITAVSDVKGELREKDDIIKSQQRQLQEQDGRLRQHETDMEGLMSDLNDKVRQKDEQQQQQLEVQERKHKDEMEALRREMRENIENIQQQHVREVERINTALRQKMETIQQQHVREVERINTAFAAERRQRNEAQSRLERRVQTQLQSTDNTCEYMGQKIQDLTVRVDKIDEEFFPSSHSGGRGAPHDGGDDLIEEEYSIPEAPTNM